MPPQFHFASLTHDNQIEHVHYLVKHQNVLPSQKDDCHPILADFGNNLSPLVILTKEKITWLNHWFFLNQFNVNIEVESRKIMKHYYNRLQFWKIPISLIIMILLRKEIPQIYDLFPLIYRWIILHLPLKNLKLLKTKFTTANYSWKILICNYSIIGKIILWSIILQEDI